MRWINLISGVNLPQHHGQYYRLHRLRPGSDVSQSGRDLEIFRRGLQGPVGPGHLRPSLQRVLLPRPAGVLLWQRHVPGTASAAAGGAVKVTQRSPTGQTRLLLSLVLCLSLKLYELDGRSHDKTWTVKTYQEVTRQFKDQHPNFFGTRLIFSVHRWLLFIHAGAPLITDSSPPEDFDLNLAGFWSELFIYSFHFFKHVNNRTKSIYTKS